MKARFRWFVRFIIFLFMVEERKIQHTEIESPKQDKPKQLFGLVSDSALSEHVGTFEDALTYGNVDKLVKLLNVLQKLELMVLKKGEDVDYLFNIDRSVRKIAKELGIPELHRAQVADFNRLLHEGNLDPMVLAQWANTQYHLNNNSTAYQAGSILSGNENLPLVVRANAMNLLGSLSDRAGDLPKAVQWNKEAVTLLQGEDSDPNTDWQRMKDKHGLIIHKARQKAQPDMIEQLSAIAQRRQELGDVMQVPRTYLDMGEIAFRLGDMERALVYLTQARDGLEQLGYDSSAFHANDKLAEVRQALGEDRRAKHVWVRGVGVGERLKKILADGLEEMKEKRDNALKFPAMCLVGLGDDKFLVEQVEVGGEIRFMCVTVDQERKASAEKIIRDKIALIIQHVLYDGRLDLNFKNTKMNFRQKGDLEDGRKFAMFSPDLSDVPGIAEALQEALIGSGLDKKPKDGYIVLSWSQILDNKAQFEGHSQNLIDREQEWRDK